MIGARRQAVKKKGKFKQDEIVSETCTPSAQLLDADAHRRGRFSSVTYISFPLPGAQFLSETFNDEHPGKGSWRQSFPKGNLFQLIGNLGFQP